MNALAIHHASHALAADRLCVVGRRKGDAARPRCANNRTGERMRRMIFNGGSGTQDACFISTCKGNHAPKRGSSNRQRSGLVHRKAIDGAQ